MRGLCIAKTKEQLIVCASRLRESKKMKKMATGLSAAALFCLQGSPLAAPITLNFEDQMGMTYWSGNAVPGYAQLSTQYAPLGVTFTSGAGYAAIVNLGVGHATSGTNGIGGTTLAGMLTYDLANPIVATFDGITDFVSLRGDYWGSQLPITLNAYDIAGALIGSDTALDSGGTLLSVSVAGIHSVQFLGTHDFGGVAIDDFTFNAPAAAKTVPEPESLILTALALGGLFTSRHRKKQNPPK